MQLGNNNNFSVGFQLHPSLIQPDAEAKPGQGKVIADAFRNASYTTDGYQGMLETAATGLGEVGKSNRATERERLVANVVLKQAEIAAKANTVVGRESRLSSKALLTSEGLSFIASGGVTSGPIGAILAEVGSRQMDSLRTQACNTIKVLGGDDQAQAIADKALKDLGKRYKKSEGSGGLSETPLYQDSQVILGALNDIKTVTCQGDSSNPKCMAFLSGEIPESRMSTGRPGGGWVDYPSGGGFGVAHSREEREWDR